VEVQAGCVGLSGFASRCILVGAAGGSLRISCSATELPRRSYIDSATSGASSPHRLGPVPACGSTASGRSILAISPRNRSGLRCGYCNQKGESSCAASKAQVAALPPERHPREPRRRARSPRHPLCPAESHSGLDARDTRGGPAPAPAGPCTPPSAGPVPGGSAVTDDGVRLRRPRNERRRTLPSKGPGSFRRPYHRANPGFGLTREHRRTPSAAWPVCSP
jgi:hypothetical protein